jgi:SH3-like domain-containing protein
MKSRFSKAAVGLALLLGGATGSAFAIDYKSIEPAAAILYDAPSSKGKRLFILRRYTPVEVLVSVEGFVKVREPEGVLGWVEKKALSDKRMLLANTAKTEVRVAADANADLAFQAEKGVALELVEAPREGWVKVRHADGPVGFVRINHVWGL